MNGGRVRLGERWDLARAGAGSVECSRVYFVFLSRKLQPALWIAWEVAEPWVERCLL